jgi:hypothetical protein
VILNQIAGIWKWVFKIRVIKSHTLNLCLLLKLQIQTEFMHIIKKENRNSLSGQNVEHTSSCQAAAEPALEHLVIFACLIASESRIHISCRVY